MLASIGNWTSKIGKQISDILERSVEDMERIQTADPSTLADAELLFRKPQDLSKEDQMRQFDAGMQFMGTTKSATSIVRAFRWMPFVEGKSVYALARNIKKLSAEDIENVHAAGKAAVKVGRKAVDSATRDVITEGEKILESVGISADAKTMKTVGNRLNKLFNYLADIDFKEIDYLENIGYEIPRLFTPTSNKVEKTSNILKMVKNSKPIK